MSRRWLLDLDRNVRRILGIANGGTGNARGYATAVVQPFSNGSGGSLPIGTVVSLKAAYDDRRVIAAATEDGTDVLGVVVGHFADDDGSFVPATAPAASLVAVMTMGVCDVLIGTGVARGHHAYVHATDGTAKGSSTFGAGAFGRFIDSAASGTARVHVGVGTAGGGGGGGGTPVTWGDPSLGLGTTADIDAGSIDEAIRRDATIAIFDDGADPVDQDFGDTAVPGSEAWAARRDHRHGMPSGSLAAIAAPSDRGWFGDGSDGDVTISADTSLSRDMYYNNLTVNASRSLNTNGFRILVAGTLTNNGTIHRGGNRGNDGSTGGAALANGTLAGAPKGGDRATSSGSVAGGAGTGTATSGWGGNGGAGGQSSGGGAGGNAGTNSYTLTSQPRTLPMAVNGAAQVLGTWTAVAGGSGGGAGGTTGILGSGGGGGSGGGVVVIAARKIVNGSGVVHADGGAGGNGASNVGAGGGGGGGGGGVVILVYNQLTGPGTIRAAGGAKGLAGTVAPAADGNDGSPGKVIQLPMT
jgi:hypothetical protein